MSYQKVLKVPARYPEWLPYLSPEWSHERAAETARRCVRAGRTNRNGHARTCVFCQISLDLHDVVERR